MKRWKRIILVLAVLGLTTFCLMLTPGSNGTNRFINYLHYIFWGNKLYVFCDSKLDRCKIKIVFENEFALIERRSLIDSLNLVYSDKVNKVIRKVIFENGNQVSDIPYDYGKQVISVFYNDKRVGELKLWRTNHYHVHRYNIGVGVIKDTIKMEGEIKGPDVDFFMNLNKNGANTVFNQFRPLGLWL